jgi:glycosyltransferase involved in cell wall biosynthesis
MTKVIQKSDESGRRSILRVVVATWFGDDPDRPRGGVEAVSATLVRALAALPGFEVSVFTFSRSTRVPSVHAWHGATIHREPQPTGSMLRLGLGRGRNRLAAFVEKACPQIVHAHDTFGIMAQRLRVPRVLTIHGFIHGDTLVGGGRRRLLRSLMWRRAEHRAWASFPYVISISPYVRERLGGIARGRIVDIENPIAPLFFDRQHAETPNVIFSAGVICRRKNTLALVEATALLHGMGIPARLRLAGGTTEPEYLALVEARIRTLGLEGSVELLGACGIDRIVTELERAAVFALVSREENAPLGIQEAMAVGVPVVASNRCGMPYQIRDGETGLLVDPEDPADIAGRCAELLRDDAFRQRASARARQEARARFSPDVVAARTASTYWRAAGLSSE